MTQLRRLSSCVVAATLAGWVSGCAWRERARPVALAGDEETQVQPAGSELPAEVQQQLAELQRRLKEREAELATVREELAKARQSEVKGPSPPQPLGESHGGAAANDVLGADAKGLAEALAREKAEREALLRELEKLRQEVSSPFGENYVPEADYLALKQELIELRRAVQEQEKEQRELAKRVSALSSGVTGKEDAPPRADGASSERLVDDTERALAVSRQRIAELEAELQKATNQGNQVANLAAENESLRSQLLEERRRADALEAKLRVAARVTDLIFRMRTLKNREGAGAGEP
ncbi:MAG: hypothetical protein KatS3mg077_0200 [Candidatus Binatia bacterium]|nr:MAG: hypothetical protein KatS3mg077_0200 [Candidatus Binatia bacterium]